MFPVKMAALAALALGFLTGPAASVTIDFVKITNNNPQNVAGQLSVDVTDNGGGTVGFKFFNNVGIASSITDVYFDDIEPTPGLLQAISSATITSSAGVAYSKNATPPNLPSGNNIGFSATDSADSNSGNPGVTANGVNSASEWLLIVFNLVSGKTFADIVASLGAPGGLRIGLHVQGIGTNGGSDSFVNVVPIPPAILLFGSALAGLGVLRYRRRGSPYA